MMIPDLTAVLGADRLPYLSLALAERHGVRGLGSAPVTRRILAEAVLRASRPDDSRAVELATAVVAGAADVEFGFRPTRVLLQDHSGVPVLADLAALRSVLVEHGRDPERAAPALPVDLVVDHSVEAAFARSAAALRLNTEREYRLNGERYRFLRWAEQALPGLRVVPPGKGIVHQVHLEHLARVVMTDRDGTLAPDTVLGTDSHTPMVNALGVLGWGVGGIEAFLALVGATVPLRVPEVVGVQLAGALEPGAHATDLALTMTEFLRARGVVGAFVEFVGPGVASLSVPDRATVANMAPEYGSTAAFFAVDDTTLGYLRSTGRPAAQVATIEAYLKEQGMFAAADGAANIRFDRLVDFDLSAVEPSAAGPRRPQDRVAIRDIAARSAERLGTVRPGGAADGPGDGSIAIAAITSCTNTSNPLAMITAGLVARAAVGHGLKVPSWVKTSLAPGSRVVTRYLERAGLLGDLAALGFDLVGYGCTTCIGNSGPLTDDAAAAVRSGRRVAAVLSGNRNFDGRVHTDVTDVYLMSPAMVVAHALAGSVLVDVTREPLGQPGGRPVVLADLWPTAEEVADAMALIDTEMFERERRDLFVPDERWAAVSAPAGPTYDWPASSTYLTPSPLVAPPEKTGVTDLRGARALVVAPDSTTTDHISPAGNMTAESLSARYLLDLGERVGTLNTYGCRRGNHEVMVRGTFANPRFRNRLVPELAGDWTEVLPERTPARVFDAATVYAARHVPLVVLAGRDYGMGSSRDWAAKGQSLLGVRAVLAESFERIHRSNLVGMGILPLEFLPGEGVDQLGLTGRELFDVTGLAGLAPRARVPVLARDEAGEVVREWTMTARVDTGDELGYLARGGFLRAVAADLLGEGNRDDG